MRQAVLALLQSRLPDLQAVYAFGSRIAGTAGPESDLDLAVLVSGRVAPWQLWELSGELAPLCGCDVDLLDFRAASTVIQARILGTGERWWAADWRVDAYEAGVLNDRLELEQARAALLGDITAEGRVYRG